jgi:succinate-semialdehyde dehydrogenase/glutarate-semialdehyde dehydrogenase
MHLFESIDPYTQESYGVTVAANEPIVARCLERANDAFQRWRATSFARRAKLLRSLAAKLRETSEQSAQLITKEMGKILAESRAEVEKCAQCAEHYAEYGERYLAEEPPLAPIPIGVARATVSFEPLGIILGVMPWNFPFWQCIRFAVPAIAAGNVVIIKPAPNTMFSGFELEKIFRKAGFPEGVFSTLSATVETIERIMRSDAVQGVALTGSELAGSSVAALAGRYLKRSVLELGGSDPFIVCADADLEQAAEAALQSRMQNAGQSCIAAKRFLVVRSAHDEFVELLRKKIGKLTQGNPRRKTTRVGPMARIDVAEKLERQLRQTVQKGAKLVCGGERERANFKPALLINVPTDSPAFAEETFGPLAVVVSVANENEAVRLANDTRYGLGASVWTRDIERGERIARRIHAGGVFVNAITKSYPQLPFGGVQRSGYGRELSLYGMREFTNVKTIVVGANPEPPPIVPATTTSKKSQSKAKKVSRK